MTGPIVGRERGPSRLSLVVAVLLVVALMAGVLAAALAMGILEFRPPAGGVVVSPTPTRAATAAPTASPAPTLSPQPSPTAAPTASPVAPTSAPGATAQATPGGVHVVQPGETLYGISLLYGVSIEAIVQANQIADPDDIRIGQQLQIPVPPSPTPGPQVHVVQIGESIVSIAELYDVTPTDLADLNNIEDWNIIFVGQELWIPGTEPEGWQPPSPAPAPSPAPSP